MVRVRNGTTANTPQSVPLPSIYLVIDRALTSAHPHAIPSGRKSANAIANATPICLIQLM